MDAQEVFNTVCDHLMEQGRKCANNRGGLPFCRYRAVDPGTGETLKCAAGVLIPDDAYHPAMEGSSWGGLIRNIRWLGRFSGLEDHVRLVNDLQQVHDRMQVNFWPRSLASLGGEHGLELPASVKEKL